MDDIAIKIRELTGQLVKLIKEADAEKDETRALYRFMMKRLPRTIVVDKKCQDKDCFIQGICDLFSQEEFYQLSSEEKFNLCLAFKFLKNEEARVSIGSNNEPEIFRGSWLDTLIFIFTKFEESSAFLAINWEKRESLKRAMGIFKSKTF